MIVEGKEVNKGMKMVDLALRYLKENKMSVIPVGPDKIPLIKWGDYQKKFPTMKQVKEWWKTFPDAQIGIISGKLSNITVVDVEAGGDWSYLPETLTVKTGGGGRHFIYRYCEGIKNKARIKELTDFRSEGGYIVAAGSTSSKGTYDIVKAMVPQEFPLHLFPEAKESEHVPYTERVTQIRKPEAPPEAVKAPQTGVTGTLDIFASTEGVTGLTPEQLVDTYPGFPSGQRNEEMTRFTGYVLKYIVQESWSTTAWDIVQMANDKNNPPLPEFELKSLFDSICRREIIQLRKDAAAKAPEAIVKALSKDGDEVKHLKEVADEQQIDQQDIYPLEMPCFDDVILGGVCPGDLVIIAGKTGEGKSSLAMDWTLSLIRGQKKAPVLWFSYELLPSHLWNKFQKMGMTQDDVAVIPAKHSTGNVAWVEAKVKEAKAKFKIKAVVIDHLGFLLPKSSSMFGGKNMSSNYATFLTQIVREIKTIAIQEEVIIIMPVHMRKTDKVDMDAIKDSVGISQESDLVFLVERERDKKKSATAYYTDFSKIILSKNRKTGITVAAWFKMFNERFVFDPDKNKVEKKNAEDKEENDEKFENVNNPKYEARPYEDAAEREVEKPVTPPVVEKTPEDLALEAAFK